MISSYNFFVDSNLVQTNSFDIQLTLVKNSERNLGGLYHFQTFDAHAINGFRNVRGKYLAGSSLNDWKSTRDGFVTIDNMRMGTTSIYTNERNYYDNHIYNVSVTNQTDLQRPLALVPKTRIEGLTFSLTWEGNSSLSISALWLNSNGVKCLTGFFNPKCLGINVFSNRIDQQNNIQAQSIFITEMALTSDTESILIYVTSKEDIS